MNYMQQVAQMLGVEIGEEFKIKGGEGKYRFNYDGILHRNEGETWHYDDDRMLLKLINGNKEIQKFILNKKEKEYLSAVIRPFRDKVQYIIKVENDFNGLNWIKIGIDGDGDIELPCFKRDIMYRGMEAEIGYSVDDLGL